ncbi:hypothetical protein ACQKHI_27885, partial [Escherichia coli]|uniref:hypothetical protein n=1 Tax=Escherichia coli TaxID=562 RepID=UPI003CFE8562
MTTPPDPHAATVEPQQEMSEPRIFELALEAGIKHGFIPDDEYRRAMDIEPGTRWTAEEVRPEQTVA